MERLMLAVRRGGETFTAGLRGVASDIGISWVRCSETGQSVVTKVESRQRRALNAWRHDL